ncbi:MAG: type I CRISPR-associated protein Cas7 [Lachnospiraceae bacterium]|nr:type I CRISPR-associated protein Cas7 [Lachnospiraceae bacterium]
MNKRVYGVLGISSIMANWNADFSGYPKTTSDGKTYGSDKALKYPMKKMWDNQGKKVVYLKSMRFTDGKKGETLLVPNSLKERYERLFQVEDLKKCKDTKTVLKNLFQAVDIKNFGATFAESGMNFSITGAVQFGQGFNKYEDTQPQEQDILSPFRVEKNKENKSGDKNADDEGKKNSTIGTKIVSDEAHYFYPFVINPLAYKEYVELGVTEGYTEADYLNFKETSLVSATAFATNSKEGCENEFALFVETEKELYLPNLTEYITFIKGETKNEIEIACGELLQAFRERIFSVEIYYNPDTTMVRKTIEGAKYFNIITRKEV